VPLWCRSFQLPIWSVRITTPIRIEAVKKEADQGEIEVGETDTVPNRVGIQRTIRVMVEVVGDAVAELNSRAVRKAHVISAESKVIGIEIAVLRQLLAKSIARKMGLLNKEIRLQKYAQSRLNITTTTTPVTL